MSFPMVKLSNLADINPRVNRELNKDDPVSFLGMADVKADNGTTTSGEERSYSEVAKGYTYFDNGDLLVAKITPCFENGKIAQAELQRHHGAGSTEFHVIRPDPERIDARFLLHFLRKPVIRLVGEMRMTGSGGQRRVPGKFVEDLEVPLPPLNKQRKVRCLLDRAESLRAQRREAIALLDELAQSIFLDMFGDPVDWSQWWPIKKVGDIAESVTYGTSAKAGYSGDLPVLRMGNITASGGIDLANLKYMGDGEVQDKHLVKDGDVLFNRTNSADLVGKTAMYRGVERLAYAGYLVRVRVNDRNCPEYLASFLNTAYMKRVFRNMCKKIVGMANINAKELRAIEIAEPPLEIQKDFAKRISVIEELKARHRRHLAELDALFASLQDRAFRGELWTEESAPVP